MAELSSWPDLGERWPSRLVATAEEDRLSFRRNFILWFRLNQCHRGVLISHSQYKLGGKAFRNNSEDKEVSQHQLGGESNMRFYSTALIIMAMATMLLALTLLTTTSGP